MKLIPFALLSALLSTGTVIAQEKEKVVIPQVGRSAIGALAALNSYNAQVALGRIAQADVSTDETLKRAAQDTGGIMGGTGAALENLKACKALVPESEQDGIQMLVDMSKLIEQQADALLKLLKAKHDKSDIPEAQKKFNDARAACAKTISENLGFDLDLVK